ncbi:hypothetical protein CHS0354_030899 [Potamilus streckersoni]|uniref:Ig-like domain-containing protein n=1 Tax=Potamilus streckersoni TaxID=2493646 RepID=A0AAE0RM28_9BIVA|nr:hypothetical protein CHS0354_030899 [Potamilus streckersoni]
METILSSEPEESTNVTSGKSLKSQKMVVIPARSKMQFGDFRLGVIVMLFWSGICTDGNPTVTLSPSSSVYYDVGGSLSLVCEVDQVIGVTRIYFLRNNTSQLSISPSSCAVYPAIIGDPRTYNSTCSQGRIFTLLIKGIRVEDHRTTWSCQVLASNGTCASSSGVRCGSPDLGIILRVPVTTVQLANGSGQTLSSSVNIVRGQSTDIKCSTAPSGSRPRALFQWYYRQGNQSPVLIVDQSIFIIPDPITVPGQTESDLLISYSTWTLTGNASYHNMYVYCQARDETNTGNYTQSDEVQLNIVYPPFVQLSTSQSIYNVTEGTQNFVFFCNIMEANPQPQANGYSWFHTMSIIQGETSSSYTLASVQRSDAGEYRCTARNDYGAGTSDSLDLIVQYPPKVKVILAGSTQQNQTAILICEALGVPADTTFYLWVHMWDSLPIRTGLKGKTNSTHSVLALERLSLESMGTYVCTASNGIMGISGMLNQTGLETLHVKGTAYILVDNARFFGENGLTVDISIPFYSDPAIESFVIQRNGRNVMNTSRTMTYLSKDTVNYQFYKETIHLYAQKVNFVIENMTREDFDNYTLVLSNSIGSTSFQFHLDPFGPPFKVQRFYFNRFIDDQTELHFDAGFNGGQDQTFVIEYKSNTSLDNVWKNASAAEIRETEKQYRLANGTFFIKVTAPSPGSYIYRMYSWNVKGRSPFSDSITVTIPYELSTDKNIVNPVPAIAGGVSAGFVIILIVTIGIFLWRRNQHPQQTEQAITLENNRNTSVRSTDGDLYEKLNSSVNSDVLMYSSLNIQTPSEDHQKYYENT